MRKLAEARRIGRLERPALAGVLVRDIINFQAGWKAITFGATVQPLVYLLAFGFGFGSLVSTVGGYDYAAPSKTKGAGARQAGGA